MDVCRSRGLLLTGFLTRARMCALGGTEKKVYICEIIRIRYMAKENKNSRNQGAYNDLVPENLGTVPPQAVELEEAVLGALMLEADKITEVQEYLTEASFYKASSLITRKMRRCSSL